MIRFKKFAPAKILKDYVESYFLLETTAKDLKNAPTDFMQNHSQGTFDLMFGINDSIEMSNHKDDTYKLSNIFIIGHQEGYFGIRIQPETCIFGVVFYPESFSKLFNFPLDEIANGGRRLDDDLSDEYLEVHEQLHLLPDNAQRVSLLNDFFVRQLTHVDFSFTKFDQLIRAIRIDGGNIDVATITDLSNMSERTLQRKMKQILGVGPKSFSKVMRIKHVLAYIHANPQKDWQDVLYLFGYYDQAHFIKDFKRYTGRTPREFVKGDKGLSGHFLGDKE